MVNAYVFGGGVTGLNFAREYAKLGHNVTVFERNSKLGGLAGYIEYFDRSLDLGPHIFHTPDKDIENYLKTSFPNLFHERDHWSKNLKNGKYYNYPISTDFIDSLDDAIKKKIYEELSSIDKRKASAATTYYEYITAIAGPTLRKMFFTDYPKKLWGLSTKELDANWAPKRVTIREKDQPFYGEQWAAVGVNGTKSIIDELVNQCLENGVEINTSCEVISIKHQNQYINEIITSKGNYKVAESDIIFNTCSLTKSARILNVECNVKYRGVILCYIHTTNTVPFGKGTDFIYVDDKDILFNRVSDQNTFVKFPNADNTVLCCEITYSEGDTLSVASDDHISIKVQEGLIRLGLLSASEIIGSKVIRLPEVYPMFSLGYRKDLSEALSKVDVFANYYSIGSLAEFAYSDLQILFAKSRDFAHLIGGKTSLINKSSIHKPLLRKNSSFELFGRLLDKKSPCFTIAEIGLNHNGVLANGFKLIDAAIDAGFDCVKFQSYKSEGRSSKTGKSSKYVEKVLGTELTDNEMFSRFELSHDDHVQLFSYAKSRGITCFSAPFDNESAQLLFDLGVDGFKIASMELSNLDLISFVAGFGLPIVLSTGMASMSEIEDALDCCYKQGNRKIVLLQCCSIYPAPASSLNLSVISTLSKAFGVPVGYSDHYNKDIMSLVSLCYGAKVIEKHVTLSRKHEGPDHALSLEPHEQINFIRSIREVESAIGNGIKSPSRDELKTEIRFKKSYYFKRNLAKGSVIKEEHLDLKAPCIGLVPKYKSFILGSVTSKDVAIGDPVEIETIRQ